MHLIKKSVRTGDLVREYAGESAKILNIGCGSLRYGPNCVNLDIVRRSNVDVVGDAHHLPFKSDSFDVTILCAILQYCRDPVQVVAEMRRVLRPGGLAIVDAPFIQPYAPPSNDLYRFTKDGLEMLFGEGWELVRSEVSIPAGSALAYYCYHIAHSARNRLLRAAAVPLTCLVTYPLRFLPITKHEVAGAFVLVARTAITTKTDHSGSTQDIS